VIRGRNPTRPAVAELVFIVVALAPVVAILTLPILVLQDGGLHLASASALQYLLTGDFDDVLTWRPGLPPNLTAELVLLGLMQVLPPSWALKLLVAAILVGFTVAARKLVVATGVPGPWAVVVLPFAWNRLLAMGFLGFSAACVLALVAIAHVLQRPTRPSTGLLAALLTVTWLTHLIPAIVATGVCATAVVAGLVAARQNGREVDSGRAVRGIALASLPVLLLTVAFVVLNPPGQSAPQPGSVLRRIISVLAMIKANVSSVSAEYVAFGLVALVLYTAAGVILLVRMREWRGVRPVDALLVSALVGYVAAVVAPEGVSGAGSYLGVRIAFFPPVLLAVWIAAHLGGEELQELRWARALRTTAIVAMSVLSLLLVAVRLPAQNLYSAMAADSLELKHCLPRGSTILQINLTDPGAGAGAEQTVPLSSQVGFLATDRRSLDVGNEAGWVPYYLWQYRESQNADKLLATQLYGTFSYPPRIDLAGALRRGERLDAILLFGRLSATQEILEDGPTRQMLADLHAHYTRAATSSRGASELWLRSGVARGCG
jgi:hypothetical protein